MQNKKNFITGLLALSCICTCYSPSWAFFTGKSSRGEARATNSKSNNDIYKTKLAAIATAFAKVNAWPNKLEVDVTLNNNNEFGQADYTQCGTQINTFNKNIKQIVKAIGLPKEHEYVPLDGNANITTNYCIVREGMTDFDRTLFKRTTLTQPLERYSINKNTFSRVQRSSQDYRQRSDYLAKNDESTTQGFIKKAVESTNSVIAIYCIQSLPVVILHQICQALEGHNIKITEYLHDEISAYRFSEIFSLIKSAISESNADSKKSAAEKINDILKQQFDKNYEQRLASGIADEIEESLIRRTKLKDFCMLLCLNTIGEVEVAIAPGNPDDYFNKDTDQIDGQFKSTGRINATIRVEENFFD